MGSKIEKGVFDAGPFIHLHEIAQFKLTGLFDSVFATSEVLEECVRIRAEILKLKNVVQKELTSWSKDFAEYLIEKYELDLGESTSIALCKQEQISLLLTDDLDARDIAKLLGFEVHGTIAIILRSFREQLISTEEAKQAIDLLYNNSTLFMTNDLRKWTLIEIDKFSQQ